MPRRHGPGSRPRRPRSRARGRYAGGGRASPLPGPRWTRSAMPSPEAALQLQEVHKRFGATPIIRGVTLSVARGERHAIIGPNGAGKSTLFNLVSGRMAPTAGTIRLDGED